jgi:hypothetical protein
MPEPIIVPPKEEIQDNNVKVDAFGSATGEPAPEVTPKEEGKPEAKKDAIVIPDDHPTIVALKAQIESVKSEYGSNLSGQRDVIKRLEQQITELGGKKDADKDEDKNLPFKPEEIVYSKDLSKEKLDDMTDNEIKLHDELMKNREVMNAQARERNAERKQQDTSKVTDLNASVRSIALELAGNDTEVANSIIESSKQFNLTGLTQEELKARVTTAHTLIPNYKPKTEPITRNGAPVKTTTDSKDPFGTDKIVSEVEGKRNGKTFSL